MPEQLQRGPWLGPGPTQRAWVDGPALTCPLCSLLTCLGLNVLFLTLNEGKNCFQSFL